MPIQLPDRLPSRADLVNGFRADLGKIEAGLNRQLGKSGIMLDPANALLGHREEKFPVADNAGGIIVHLGLVHAKSQHIECIYFTRSGERFAQPPAMFEPSLGDQGSALERLSEAVADDTLELSGSTIENAMGSEEVQCHEARPGFWPRTGWGKFFASGLMEMSE